MIPLRSAEIGFSSSSFLPSTTILLVLLTANLALGCDFDETTVGCRLATADEIDEEASAVYDRYSVDVGDDVECLCGIGCARDFPFASRTDCLAHLEAGRTGKLLPLRQQHQTPPRSTITSSSSTTTSTTTTTTTTTTTPTTTTPEEDPCMPTPCLNGGQCIHLRFARFRCECAGTDHYGDFCQNECPEQMPVNAFGYADPDHPLDCIKI